ncbi:NrfD/PsrC family molybdoenzyme membrane anchor subunit [Adlercreutzia sp. ZJ154]|uniref:NrfD/PsrC family molybdoenzyme membrane anchor subunit n=1 Tax=Adlercreutzia sp. ZJ154 TaxID=2709790 RepID=UPI0013ECCEAB|nr:NrfD/PsrC family molybdoenzyme membrane anchor subunit [Adlercreutzia sp. ZJ154]
MFGELAIAYLFLGGAGAGCLIVCSTADLAFAHQLSKKIIPKTVPNALNTPMSISTQKALRSAFAAGYLFLTTGAFCLLADLGRADRALNLFTNIFPTFITMGTFAIAITLIVAFPLVLSKLLYLPQIKQNLTIVLELLTIAFGFVTAIYTGLLLCDIEAVNLWATPLIPILFTLSALSCGEAILIISIFFTATIHEKSKLLKSLIIIDVVLLAAELICVVIFWTAATNSSHSGLQESVRLLTTEPLSLLWWGGFVFVGLLIPLIAEITLYCLHRTRRRNINAQQCYAIVATMVLFGALCMRWSIVDAGAHAQLALDYPKETSSILEERDVS